MTGRLWHARPAAPEATSAAPTQQSTPGGGWGSARRRWSTSSWDASWRSWTRPLRPSTTSWWPAPWTYVAGPRWPAHRRGRDRSRPRRQRPRGSSPPPDQHQRRGDGPRGRRRRPDRPGSGRPCARTRSAPPRPYPRRRTPAPRSRSMVAPASPGTPEPFRTRTRTLLGRHLAGSVSRNRSRVGWAGAVPAAAHHSLRRPRRPPPVASTGRTGPRGEDAEPGGQVDDVISREEVVDRHRAQGHVDEAVEGHRVADPPETGPPQRAAMKSC